MPRSAIHTNRIVPIAAVALHDVKDLRDMFRLPYHLIPDALNLFFSTVAKNPWYECDSTRLFDLTMLLNIQLRSIANAVHNHPVTNNKAWEMAKQDTDALKLCF